MSEGQTVENKTAELPHFTPEQWWALPRHERARFRQLRRAQRTAGKLELDARESIERLQKLPPPRADGVAGPTPENTPFRTIDNKPIHLDGFAKGASCFIILSGPSLLSLDLRKLNRRGIFTIGVNNSPAILRPNGWIFVDPPSKFHESIWLDPAILKFVHHRFLMHKHVIRHKKEDGTFENLAKVGPDGKKVAATIADCPGVIGAVRNADFRPERWLSECSINWGNSKRSAISNKHPRCLNVMFAVLKLAYALGFRACYLLGCDFNMSPSQPYAFAQSKGEGECGSNNGAYQTMNVMLGMLKGEFDKAGFRVMNCNPRSGLTVFPKVSFDAAIEAATGHVPQDPLDTSDWYKK